MATAHRILIPADDTGLWKTKQDEEAAVKVSELLQADLEKHHVFFNQSGFHNHIAHQLLALYGTGATPSTLQAAYDANKSYQLKAIPVRSSVIAELQEDWSANASKYLGSGKHYSDFLNFFQLEMDKNGWEAVVSEYLCQDTPKSRDIVQRLFAGILHPMIQLQYGLEWEQPAIIASGLAQAAIHRNPLGEFYDKVDVAVKNIDQSGVEVKNRGISEVCENIHEGHEKLASIATWEDNDRLYEAVLGRGLQEAVALAATLRVGEDELEERVAEMWHHNAYVAAAASWNPPHVPKYDFFLIHNLNSSPFVLSFNKPFISKSAQIRILEHKMRYDLVQYIARGCPSLNVTFIRDYNPQNQSPASKPSDLLRKYHSIIDDGHLIKVARSLLIAQEVSRKWKGRPWVRLDEDDWLKAHYMLLKGAEGQEGMWVRSAGFKEAWKEVPKL
ncbi:hypothetical protein QQS21_004509 [Conoideocrella luteorostrata]|uniref:HypA protein n=1 Tax=Conoideocrella luteorostrata TaxID=1105319 RepID=A0AAJ0FUL3_9HYPO|nr:hypothetical protein QQS21_004509 [Conoideocrella luteorostrata]